MNSFFFKCKQRTIFTRVECLWHQTPLTLAHSLSRTKFPCVLIVSFIPFHSIQFSSRSLAGMYRYFVFFWIGNGLFEWQRRRHNREYVSQCNGIKYGNGIRDRILFFWEKPYHWNEIEDRWHKLDRIIRMKYVQA